MADGQDLLVFNSIYDIKTRRNAINFLFFYLFIMYYIKKSPLFNCSALMGPIPYDLVPMYLTDTL